MRQLAFLMLSVLLLASCSETPSSPSEPLSEGAFTLHLEDFKEASDEFIKAEGSITLEENQWMSYEIDIPATGRYRITAVIRGESKSHIWIEDYIFNSDDRTYNITGNITPVSRMDYNDISVDGSPLQKGKHDIKVHGIGKGVQLKHILFEPIQSHFTTGEHWVQHTDGEEWNIVWSDEFDGSGLPDSSKWNYNIGNWGWGNNELQYYTGKRIENARQENGYLMIEAHRNDMGQPWTSARLTTAGKHSFTYGKIEFRAKIPVGRGTWSAGWMLGDDYKDEISWPYCGEIDILECVGYEVNDSTGDGINHASCHTRAYYFKQGNHLTSTIPVENMNSMWHTYSIEWYPHEIKAFVDGQHYYTYDKNENELEWPFDKPQNLIINLAVGGGWGGAKGIDEQWQTHQLKVDYIRVYEKLQL